MKFLLKRYIGCVAKIFVVSHMWSTGCKFDMLDLQESVVKGRNYHLVTQLNITLPSLPCS